MLAMGGVRLQRCNQVERLNRNLAKAYCKAEIFRAIPYGNERNAKCTVLFQRKTAGGKTQKRKSVGCGNDKCVWFGKSGNGIHLFVMLFVWG